MKITQEMVEKDGPYKAIINLISRPADNNGEPPDIPEGFRECSYEEAVENHRYAFMWFELEQPSMVYTSRLWQRLFSMVSPIKRIIYILPVVD